MTPLALVGMILAIPIAFMVIGMIIQIVLRLVDAFGEWLDERLKQ
jgi:hypothetical protein